jgi:hypothetical protein
LTPVAWPNICSNRLPRPVFMKFISSPVGLFVADLLQLASNLFPMLMVLRLADQAKGTRIRASHWCAATFLTV